eukprot:scaffold86522_cov15-Prasinocladus_malaysianus.AAC.1
MTKPNFCTKCQKEKCCCTLHSIEEPLPAGSDGKEHALRSDRSGDRNLAATHECSYVQDLWLELR